MGPEHHEERLRSWAVQTGKPVISIEYGKAPECQLLFRFGLSTVPESLLSRRVKLLGLVGKTLILFSPAILRTY